MSEIAPLLAIVVGIVLALFIFLSIVWMTIRAFKGPKGGPPRKRTMIVPPGYDPRDTIPQGVEYEYQERKESTN